MLIIREKGTYPVEGWVPRNHPQLHAVIELSQLNPSVETFSPPQAATGDTSTNGAANPTTCGVTVEAASVPRPGKVALQMVPVILEGENGIIIRANAFLVGSGSSYLKGVDH